MNNIPPSTGKSEASVPVSCSHFSLSDEDVAKIAAFVKDVETVRGSDYAGAIGGATTYMFTPTSLGISFKVRHFEKELDLTDYASW